MKNIVTKIDEVLAKIEENLTFILFFAMLIIVFLGFISRYIFNAPLTWSEELSRYLMIWATFIAASYGVKKGAHITLDVLVVYLNEKANKILRVVSYIFSVLYCILIIVAGTAFVLKQSTQLSPAMQIPMYFVYLSVAVGTLLMLVRYVILFVKDVIYNEEIENANSLEELISK